jgi:PAS domain S-box-containing protein
VGRLSLAFAVSLGLLTGVLVFHSWKAYSQLDERAHAAGEAVHDTKALLSSLQDAETGQRDFLLTNEDRYLESYRRAAAETSYLLDQLVRATAAAPDEAQRVERLRPLVSHKLNELKATIEARRAIVPADRGRAATDEIRAAGAAIESTANARETRFAEDAKSRVNRLALVSFAGIAILAAFCFVASTTFESGFRKRRRLLHALDESRALAKEANALLETALFSVEDGVITTDGQGKVTRLNGIAQSLTGWSQDEAIGKVLEQLFAIRNTDTGLEVENPVRKVLREGAAMGLANHSSLIGRDGHRIPIDASATPIRDAKGGVLGVMLVFRNITDRQDAEAAQGRLASVIESSDDAIVTKDLNGIVTSWNRGAERIFGYSAEEMIGNPIAMLAPPDHADEMPRILERLRRGERIDHFQTVRRTKTGKAIHVSVTISPVRDANGQITGASKIARDITAEIEGQAEIAMQRERLRVTLSSIGDAVIATDREGSISYLNPVAEQLTGWAGGTAIGQPLDAAFRIVHGDSRRFEENPLAQVSREGRTSSFAYDTLLLSRDGREIAIDYSVAPIRDARNETAGVVLAFRDVTGRRAAEKRMAEQTAELRVSNATLSRVNEDLSLFAFAASHDLQEPLRAITSYSELLLKAHGDQVGEEAATCLGFITEGTRRMRDLLSDLLAYTQVTGNGDAGQAFAPIDLNQVLAETLENCKTAIEEARAAVTSDHLPSIPGDPQHFMLLFQNLIGNALKYRSERQPRIHVSAERGNGRWLLSVADNGIGIAPEYHAQIFGAFKRLHGRSIAGTGVGLAICQRVVARYGGRIWVESQVNEGATFYFTLPGIDTA